MSIQDDVKTLRDSGEPDSKILSSLKSFHPEHSNDIDSLLKAGEEPTKVLDEYLNFNEKNNQNSRSVINALKEGGSEGLSGVSSTVKNTIGQGKISEALDSAANLVRPADYSPASDSMGKGSSWGGFVKDIPYKLAEAAPGIATDLAAGAAGAEVGGGIGSVVPGAGTAAGALIGGGLGFGASYLARSYGSDAEHNAAARTGNPQATPDTSDKARALAQGLIGATLSKIGLGAAGGTAVKAGEAALPAILGQAMKGAAVDAGTSAAADASHQLLTPNNQGLDTNALLQAAALGGVTGAAVRSIGGVSDLNNSSKFNAVDPVIGQRLAARFKDQDTTTPSSSFVSLNNVKRDLSTEVDHYSREAAPLVKSLQKSSDYQDDTSLVVSQARATLRDGQPLNPETLATLGSRLGEHREGANLTDAMAEMSALNQVIASGTMDQKAQTFGGGITGQPFVRQWIRPLGPSSLSEVAASTAVPALLGHGVQPQLAAGTLATQTGLYGAAKAVDSLLGNANPLGQFTARFVSEAPPLSIMARNSDLPSFRQAQAQAGVQQGAPGPLGAPQAPIAPSSLPLQPQATTLAPTGFPGAPNDSQAPTSRQSPPVPGDTGTNKSKETSSTMSIIQAAELLAQTKAQQQTQGQGTIDKGVADRLMAAEALAKAKGGQSGAGTTSGSPASPKAPKGSAGAVPQATRSGNEYQHHKGENRIIVTRGDHVVNRSANGVDDVGAYADRIHSNLETRGDAFDRAMTVVKDARDRKALDTLHHSWNQTATSWASAYSRLEDVVNDLHVSDADKGKILDHLSTPKVIATWAKQKAD